LAITGNFSFFSRLRRIEFEGLLTNFNYLMRISAIVVGTEQGIIRENRAQAATRRDGQGIQRSTMRMSIAAVRG